MLFCSLLSAAQASRSSDGARNRQEFPLQLQQRVVAGQTEVRAPVQGKLIIATLVRGTVIPAGAMFSGTVEESIAKTAAAPSRLKVHMTKATWDDKSLAVDLFLANSFYEYPKRDVDETKNVSASTLPTTIEELRDYAKNEQNIRRNSAEINPWPRRTVMLDVSQERGAGGQIVLTSMKQNLRLDREVLYAFEGSAVEKPAGGHGK
jgi:hypothetical protein